MSKGVRKAGPKDPYEDLPPEFKDAIAGSTIDEIKSRIAAVRVSEGENQRLKREDLHVQEVKLALDKLTAPYKVKTRENNLAEKQALAKKNQSDFMSALQAEAQNTLDLEMDDAVAEARAEFKDATATYAEATKMNALKVKFSLRVLSDRGAA